jgi:hypothetical protein
MVFPPLNWKSKSLSQIHRWPQPPCLCYHAPHVGYYKEERTVVALVAALRDPAAPVRESAAQALRQVGMAQAIPSLLEALRDSNGAVRYQAAKALVDLKWDSVDPAERALLTVALGDIEQSTVYGADAVEPLMLTLQDGAYYQRQARCGSPQPDRR